MQKRPTKRRIFRNLRPITYGGIATGAYDIDKPRLDQEFDRICRGIHYFHYHEHWPHAIMIAFTAAINVGMAESRGYFKTVMDAADVAKRFLKDEPQLGENPDVFNYQQRKRDNPPGYILRMVFFGGIEVVGMSVLDQ
jgi:hypothetical protein